jgi:exosortase E/protease (VPEID-CTERM system)
LFGLMLLLLAEVGWLTLRFDAPDLNASGAWSARLLAYADAFPRIGIGLAGSLILLVSPRLSEIARGLRAPDLPQFCAWTACQILAFAAFFFLTSYVFGLATTDGEVSTVWLVSWLSVGGATIVSWLLTIATWGSLRRLAIQEWRAIICSLGVGILVWFGGLLARKFWRPLAEFSMSSVHGLLTLIYPDVFQDEDNGLVGTGSFLVEIAPQCSGYEGIALVIAFVAVYLWIYRDDLSFPRSLMLFPLGILSIWLTNVLRIATLVVIGTSISPQIASEGFHSQAGWIAFTLVTLGLVALSHRARFFFAAQHETASIARIESGVAVALLAPQLALLATTMITAALSSPSNILYPVGVVASVGALWHFRETYRAMRWTWSWDALGIGIAVAVVWIVLEPAHGGSFWLFPKELAEFPLWLSVTWLAFRVFGFVVTVPIVEELAFRGFLIRKLIAKDFESVPPHQFTWFSFAVSSVLFGLLHEHWLPGTIAGAGFALALYRRGQLGDAIVAHMTANGLVAVSALSGGRWVV